MSDSPSLRRALRGARTQLRVIRALMIRDAVSRYGHENLGFFWVMGEPLLLTSGVMGLWSVTNHFHDDAVGVVPFALTGYSMLTLWRHVVFKSVHAMRYNAALTYHSNIKFFDILCARAFLETIGILTAFLIAYVPLALLGYLPPIRDPLVLFGGWFLTAWFSFSFGLVLAGASELSEPLERFIQPAMYLTLPLTGAFYMVGWLPPQAREIVLWSPLVHGVEMFRGAVFPADVPTEWDPWYIAYWCLALMGVGLPLCRYAERHVTLT